jgi:Tfp pilus assembly protein PilF
MQRGGADIEKAIALFQAGNPAAAAQACRAALRRDERNVAALFVLALTQMQRANTRRPKRNSPRRRRSILRPRRSGPIAVTIRSR